MNANDELRQYTGTEKYYLHTCGLIITDGAKELADRWGAYWLLDIIASYQAQLKKEEFQVWTIGRNEDSTAIIICTNGNNKILITQAVPYTDFVPTVATVWVSNNGENSFAMLPSEY